jgi:threonyl-tRNA synthetase
MSTTSVHPVHSTSEPAHAAEGLEPVTPGASATGKHAVGAAQPDGVKKEKPQQQGKGKDKKDKKAAAGGEAKGPLELSPPPEYFQERIKIYDEYKAKYDKWVSGASFSSVGSCVLGAE